MIKHETDAYQKLMSEDQNGETCGKIYILKGEYGLGQADFLQAFRAHIQTLRGVKAALDIRLSANSFSLYSIWNSLKQHISVSFELDDLYQPVSSTGLNYEEYIISKLLVLGQEKELYFFCEDISRCNAALYEFTKKIVDCLFPNTPAFMMCCFYQNQESSMANMSDQEVLDFFATLGNRTKYISFPLWTEERLRNHLSSYLQNCMDFPDTVVNSITQAAIGNPTQLLGIVEYLKSEGIIYEEDGLFRCQNFDEELLLFKAEQYVASKYRRLAPSMQHILKSSSIIGYEFDKNLLANPLNILLSDAQLKKIEHLTHLIHAKDDDLFEFHNNASHLSIKNIVPSEEYVKWNLMLADHFYREALHSQQNFDGIEVISFLSRSAYYYSAAEQKEKTTLIYLRLIPLLISIMDYEKALSVISNLRQLYQADHSLIAASDLHRLYMLEGDCHYSLFKYNEAAIAYRRFVEANFVTKIEFLSAQCQYAIALYGTGETEEPYKLLEHIYLHMDDGFDEKIVALKVKILSLMSSIEETIWNGKHVEHFNQALALAKKHNLVNEYYQLLRKALIVYKGKNGIRLMASAKEYYERTNNIKEYAMCLHNMATEMLYDEDLELARLNLEESIRIFQSFGSDGIHYPINALGNYWALKGNFQKAIACYQNAYNPRYELFSQIGVLINLATAHRSLKQYKKAMDFLRKVEKLLSVKQTQNYAILRQHYYLSIALTETGHSNERAYRAFLQYFDNETNVESHRMTIASRALRNLCNVTGMQFPTEFESYVSRNSTTIERLDLHQLVLVRFSFAE